MQGQTNSGLSEARRSKNDEFYTRYADIESEMNAYLEYNADVFADKTILLPCDDPEWSNFTKYFAQNFERLKLKKLISTSYATSALIEKQPTLFEVESPQFDAEKTNTRGKVFTLTKDITGDRRIDLDDFEWRYLEGDGDFRSDEVRALRDEADVIITNPPFSLFREFLKWIREADKRFALIGNMNAITYKEVFPYIRANRIWLGATNFNTGMYFRVPPEFKYADTYKFKKELDGVKVSRVPGVCWFTNIEHGRRYEPLTLMTEADNIKFGHKSVKGKGYKKYDNYDAIEVPQTKSIPGDHTGVMGVPISFLDKYCPEQFEILGSQRWAKSADLTRLYRGDKTPETDFKTTVDGRETYDRIFIKHRRPDR